MVPNATIAIIDDDREVLLAIENLISSLGINCLKFANAEAFLSSCNMSSVKCIITDVNMPGIGGIELQNTLNRTGRPLPIIFITAYPQETKRQQAEGCGAFAFLTKPFDANILVAFIFKALNS